MEDRDADPNLSYYRRANMEAQVALAKQQQLIATLRRRATLQGIEEMGYTTETAHDERW